MIKLIDSKMHRHNGTIDYIITLNATMDTFRDEKLAYIVRMTPEGVMVEPYFEKEGERMSTEPEPTMIWLSKDDFSRLKEDLLELFEGDSRKGERSLFYPNVWKDVICDDGRTVQLKLNAAWRKREGFVHLKKRDGKRTFVSPYGSLCGCTVLPTGE